MENVMMMMVIAFNTGRSSFNFSEKSKLGLDTNCIKIRRHLSKSTSELSNNGSGSDDPRTPPPQRVKSAGATSVSGVLQRTHGFFSTIKVTVALNLTLNLSKTYKICLIFQNRLSRGRSRERGRKSPTDADGHSDYAADTSDHSSSSTPLTQSPRHRVATISDSPLVRQSQSNAGLKTDSFKVAPKIDRQPSYARASIESLSKDDLQRRRESELRKHSFFQLKVNSIRGQGLIAMDKSGKITTRR